MSRTRTLQPGRFAPPQEPIISDLRDLTRADLAVLTERRPPTYLKTLRDNHHRVARAIAAGLDNETVAALCGITANRVSMYKADPAMSDLIAHYRAIATADYVEARDTVNDYMRSVQIKSLAMMEDKLDASIDASEHLPTRDLIAMAELGLDRTGYGKTNKNININVGLAAHIEGARARIAAARVIEGAPTAHTHALNLAPASGNSPPAPARSVPALRRL